METSAPEHLQTALQDAAVPILQTGLKIGIAFGGGGARGVAHVHVIEALNELGITPHVISGSSIGAIMGAGMAAGMTGKDIRAYALSTFGDRTEVAGRMWRLRPTSFGEMFSGGLRFSQFNVERVLKAFLPDGFPQRFDQLQLPLKVTATDFYGQSEVVFDDGDLLSALAASAAIPAVFKPIRHEGKILIDGGIYNPVPFDLIHNDVDIVVAIDVVGGPEGNLGKMPGAIDAMFGASQLMMQSIIAMKLKTHRPAVFLRPPVSRFRVLDFLKIDQILEESASVKDELKRAVDAAIAFADGPAQAS